VIYGDIESVQRSLKKDRRWKIEHAQVIQEADFDYFKLGIIPSVQPTHATSDMYWAGQRLGRAFEKCLCI
jgi:predicted amidohydrolase YtcJ